MESANLQTRSGCPERSREAAKDRSPRCELWGETADDD